jgi:hypothetical protein
MQEDPLAKFGAVDRELPDKDLAATIALQDALIHYDKCQQRPLGRLNSE